MSVSVLIDDLAYLFAYALDDAIIAIGSAFLAGAFIYSIAFVTVWMIRND